MVMQVSEVINWMHEVGCLVFVWGGSVRDAVLGLAPTDIDLTVTCNPHYLKRVCVEQFGKANCARPRPGSEKLVIGNDRQPIEDR
jgi:hypothetical protein